ncbi:MAG TPA: hypothetical protein VI636_23805 [Candidatus Angelobacter sp.]
MLLSSLLLATVAVAADTITGTVHNQTTSQPAVGDQVVLLRLGEGMQEEGRTKTDAQGRFTLNVTSPNDQHLIQVSHQGVSYDQSVTGTAEVEITVYDTAPSIPGMRGPIGIAQVESDGKLLKITEMYDIRNNSEPPVTQSRTDNFAIALPADAELDFAEVRRGQGIWTKVKPDPVKGKSGKFRLNYPIRPGDTLFKFIYHLPYEGPTTLHLRVPYPIEKFAVMHPPTMVFKASRAGAFISPDQLADNLKVEAAVTVPTVGDVPAFQISGVGISPPHGTEVLTGPRAVAAPAAAAAAHPPAPAAAGAALEQSRKELWFMLTGMVVILALAVFAVWRIRKPMASAVAPKSLLDTLKDELFQLENDRLRGAVSAEEYAANKQALNRSIRRLLEKQPRR